MQWMILPFRRYFDFQGRSRRLEYWMFVLLNVLVIAAIAIIAFASSGWFDGPGYADPGTSFAGMSSLQGGLGIVMLVWWLATIVPGIAVTVRRLHDRDMSGWWYPGLMILSFVVPFVGPLASIALLVLMVLPGTEGPNRFGPSPKSEVTAEVFT